MILQVGFPLTHFPHPAHRNRVASAPGVNDSARPEAQS